MNAGESLFALLQPSNAIFALMALGFVTLFVRRKVGTALLATGAVLYGTLGLLPVGQALLRPLEARYGFDPGSTAPDGIIILGGFISADRSHPPYDLALTEQAERLTTAAVLARRYPEARIIVTDGTVDPAKPPGAEASADLLEAMGVAPDRLVAEGRSLSTLDNAVFSKAMVDPQPGQRYVLVTSAWHMPRAVATFEAAGWPGIEPWPVDYVTDDRPLLNAFPGAASRGLALVDLAAREYAATLAYRLAGRLDPPADIGSFPAEAKAVTATERGGKV